MPSSGMWRRVDLVNWTDVSEERIASIFRVEKSASEEPAWAGGCQEIGGTASVLYHPVASERVTRRYLIPNVSLGNITLCRDQHVSRELQVGRACSTRTTNDHCLWSFCPPPPQMSYKHYPLPLPSSSLSQSLQSGCEGWTGYQQYLGDASIIMREVCWLSGAQTADKLDTCIIRAFYLEFR
jgi:hypothetical protein